VAFVDELASGVAPASAPDIARDLGLSPGHAAGAILVAFYALALVVEAPLLAWSERLRVRWFSAGALAAMALVSFAAAAAPGPWPLLLSLAVYGPAAGCALAASEGVLVEARPDERERTMARLGLAASLGDLAVPALLAALAVAGLGWRAGLGVAAASAAALALLHASSRGLDRPGGSASTTDDDGTRPGVLEALRFAIGARPLLWWSLATALTSLLDEVLVAFAAVRLDDIGASPFMRSAAVAGWTVGGLGGLAVLERAIDRLDPLTTLLRSSALSAVALATLAATRSPIVASVAFTVLGASAAALHPLAKARTYAALPGRPALVNAVAGALLPFDVAAPLLLGAVAARAGSAFAVGALLIAPVGIAAVAARARASRQSA
jgi:MFS family permease